MKVPAHPDIFSSTAALKLTLRDNPKLMEGKTHIVIKGELYSIDHSNRQVIPVPSPETPSNTEEALYTKNLRQLFNVNLGTPETADKLKEIIFSSPKASESSIDPAVSFRPKASSFPSGTAAGTDALSALQAPSSSTLRAKPPSSDDVICGLDRVDQYENQGIPRSYLEKTQTVADKLEMIFAIRPVERICRTLIEEGCASKGLNIKGKSSNWGPMAGYIPYDQKLSKLAAIESKEQRELEIADSNKKNRQAVMLGGVNIETLTLSPTRWQELTTLGHIQNITLKPDGKSVFFQSRPSGQEPQTFQGQKQKDGQWTIYTDKGEPLKIIRKTADFDLFFSFSHFSKVDLATLDKKRDFDPFLGIYSERDQTLISALNTAYNRGEGKDMVHHGSDTSNPQTVLESNFPTTVFIPNGMLPLGKYSQSPLLIKSVPELIDLFRTMREGGIRIESNALWKELQEVVKEPVKALIAKYEQHRDTQ